MQKEDAQKSLYAVLNVEENATFEVIKNSYACYIFDYQNEFITNFFRRNSEDHEQFNVINYAFGVLSNPSMRSTYDLCGTLHVQMIYANSMFNFENFKTGLLYFNTIKSEDKGSAHQIVKEHLKTLATYIPYIFNTVIGKQMLDFVDENKHILNIDNEVAPLLHYLDQFRHHFLHQGAPHHFSQPELHTNRAVGLLKDTKSNQSPLSDQTTEEEANITDTESDDYEYTNKQLFFDKKDVEILDISSSNESTETDQCLENSNDSINEANLELTQRIINDVEAFLNQNNITSSSLDECLTLYSSLGKNLPIPTSLDQQRMILDHYRKIAVYFSIQKNHDKSLSTLAIAKSLPWYHEIKKSNPELIMYNDILIHTIIKDYHDKIVYCRTKELMTAATYFTKIELILKNDIPSITMPSTRNGCLLLLLKIYHHIAQLLTKDCLYDLALQHINKTRSLLKNYSISDKKTLAQLSALEKKIKLKINTFK